MRKPIFLLAALAILPLLAEETSNVDYGQGTTSPMLNLIWGFRREPTASVTYAVITNIAVTSGENPAGDIAVPMSLVCSDGTPLIVKKIDVGAFANQIGITSISIPVTIEQIDSGAFTGCTVLSAIDVDAGNPWFTTSAGALYDKDHTKIIACPARTETIQLPITLTEIDAKAFANCHRLLSLNVPASVTAIGARAFKDCTRLSSITFEGNAPTADPSIVEGANASLVFYKEPGSTGWDASPWNVLNVQDAATEQPSGVISTTAGHVTWYYRVVNGEAEIYNNGTAAIPTSTAETYTYDPVTFVRVGDGRLVIPSSLGGYPVTRIGDYAFSGCSALDVVSIPKSVRKIGDYAFANCTGISTLTLPSGVQAIGYHPFSGAAITTLDLPDSLRTLDGNPLAGCDTALSVTISAANSYYAVVNGILYDKDIRTLVGCPARSESVSIPATVTQIGPEAFDGCFRLRAMMLPDSLVSVGTNAFRDATRLASVVFPASLAELEGPGLFEDCSSLSFIGFTGNAPAIDPQLFASAPASLVVYVAQGTTGWKDATPALPDSGKWPTDDAYGRSITNLDVSAEAELKEGDIFVGITTNGSTRYAYTLEVLANRGVKILGISPKPIDDFEVPSSFESSLGTLSVKALGDRLFANAIGLLSVNIPNSVTAIGDEVFKDCNVLASVTLAHGLRAIGRHPFEGTAIETIALPDTVSAIDGNIFFGCDPSVSLSVGDNNPYFAESEEGALYDKDFENLCAVPMTAEELTVPATTTNIADEAFANCIRLKSLVFLGNAPTAADGILADTPATLGITVQDGSLGWDGDPASSALPASGRWRDRTITADIEPPVADSNTDGTWKWKVENGVATLYNGGNSALLDTNYNGAVSVPAEVTDSATGNRYAVVGLGDHALYGCKLVTSVTLPSTIESIGKEPFFGTKITSLRIPAYVSSIDGNPAIGCARFTGFSVDGENIDFSADASGLLYSAAASRLLAVPARATEIEVPATVTAIADDAFAGCSVLAKVTFLGNAPTAADGIFADTPAKMTSYANEGAGFPAGTWKSRPVVIPAEDPNHLVYDDGAIVWHFRVVDDAVEIYNDGDCAIESSDGTPITAITLPATLGGYVVKGIGDGALANLRGITSISVPNTYEWIDDGVFSNCTSLASVALGTGIEMIGRWPFYGTKLTTLTIPDSVSAIDGNPVAGASLMQTVVVAGTQPYFSSSDGLLYDKKQETLIACPATKTSIALPSTLQAINSDAFYGCNLIDDVTTIFDDAVWTFEIHNGQAIITELSDASDVVTIPAALNGYPVSEIADGAFVNCTNITAFSSESSAFSAKHGILYSADGSELICVPATMTLPYTLITSNTTMTVTTHLEAGTSGEQPYVERETVTNAPSTTVSRDAVEGDISFVELLQGVTRIRGYAFNGVNIFNDTCTTNVTPEGVAYSKDGTANADVVSTLEVVSTTHLSEITIDAATTVVDENAFTHSGLTCRFAPAAPTVVVNVPAQIDGTPAPSSASTYSGYLVGTGGNLAGTIQVKTAKARNGVSKTTVVIQINGQKKKTLRGSLDIATGEVDGLDLSVGGTYMTGTYNGYSIAGARNRFSSQNKNEVAAANAVLNSCPGTLNISWAGGMLSAKIAKKGKVSISGTLATGKKISASTQAVIYEDWLCIPVSLSKTDVSFLLWVSPGDGGATVQGIAGAVAGAPGTLASGARFRVNADALADMVATSLSSGKSGASLVDEIPDGVAVSQTGSKLSVAANASALKLRYTAKTGSFKGSFKAYYMLKGKRKSKTVNVAGVMVDGVGYGYATIKKADPVPVEIW